MSPVGTLTQIKRQMIVSHTAEALKQMDSVLYKALQYAMVIHETH